MPIVVGGKVIYGTTPYSDPERTAKAIEQAEKDYAIPIKSSTTKTDRTTTGAGTAEDPLRATTVTQPDRELSEANQSLIDALRNFGITKSTIVGVFTTPLTVQAAAYDDGGAGQGIYSIIEGNRVTVVQAKDVYAAADKYGTYIGDPDTSIRRLDIGCYPPTYQEAKDKYEKDPRVLGEYTPQTPQTPPAKDTGTTVVTGVDLPVDADEIKPEPYIPVVTTRYQFTLPSGNTHKFEAMTPEDAARVVESWNADIDTLEVVGQRLLSQFEVKDILQSAASHSDMDYARALIKYNQVEGFVPVRDGKTRDAMLIAESDWNALTAEDQNLVTTKGLDALTEKIYDSLPDHYREIADKDGLDAAITIFNGDVERANEVIDKLKPYKDGDSYDIVTPVELGIVTGDDLRVAGFDSDDVKGVEDYVNRLSSQLAKWDKYVVALKAAIAEHGDKPPQIAALEIHRATSGILTNVEEHELYNAVTESGAIKKYGLGGSLAEITSLPDLKEFANKWKDIKLEDKYNVAEIHASYPAPNKLLAAGYRGLIAQAPQMNAAARFAKEFLLGGAAATIQPFVKEQYKDSLETLLKDYKENGGYNLTEYLKDNSEDGSLLLRAGIELKDVQKALDGQTVIVQPKGASSKDWAVAGLIVTAMGAGGASIAATGLTKAALVSTSGLATLGLGTYATIDTAKYWRQMDNTQRAIAIAFDVLLLTTGALATKGGLTSFKQQGGFLKIRNQVQYSYRAARNFVKRLLPDTNKANSILADIDKAMRTGDTKLLKAAARQLELEAAKMPKEIGEPLQNKARLLQAAPDDVLKLRDAPKDAPDDFKTAIDNLTEQIKAYESALRRVKNPRRYNTIKEALEKTVLDREALVQKTRVATKEKTTTTTPLQEPVEAGKYVPAKAGTTTAITKAKPPPVEKPSTIEFGTKKVPIETIRKKTPSEVAQKHFISIWDISRAIRKLPKGVQEEIALYSPEWSIIVKTKGATITATKTALRRNLRRLQEQEAKPAARPEPKPATATQPQLATATKPETKKKLKVKEALAIYPFFTVPQDIKTKHKRKRPRLDSGEYEDISARLPKERQGIITRKQGLFYITIFPPYRPEDRIYTRKKPYYAESSRGRGSPQRTLKTVGGKVPHLVQMPMGIVKTTIKGGDIIKFTPRSTRRRRKGRRRGRLVYA